jgi:2-amino-4-hydroxy-6-hydroxymethyldihydropteridine diphosphokinase
MSLSDVCIALGANLGDPKRQLDGALAALSALPRLRVDAISSWHPTAPVGGPPGQPDYLNGAMRGVWQGEPEALLDDLQAVERRFGRDRAREGHHGARPLDLDLLLFGDRRQAGPRLVLPHPGLEQRLFVLAPLAEIAPDLVLPDSGVTVAVRLAQLRRAESSGGHGRGVGAPSAS